MTDLDKRLTKELIQQDWGFTTLGLSTMGLIISATIGLPHVATLTLALLLFTSFDVIGYNAVTFSPNRMDLVRYRAIQTVFQWIVFTLVGTITDWNLWTCVGYIILWWIGVCDVLFYVLIGKQKQMQGYEHMPWLWWTPLGIINKRLGRTTNGNEVYNVAIWSTIIWYSMPLFFRNLQWESLSWFSNLLPF